MAGNNPTSWDASAAEASLIERAKRMDEQAWRQIYDEHYRAVYAYLLPRTNDATLAEDLTAEVFARAVKGIGGFTYQGITIGTWLMRIARNLLIDQYRYVGIRRPVIELGEQMPSQSASLHERAEIAESVAELQQALAQLTEEQQQVIWTKFVWQMSTAEVAEQLRKTEGAVKALQRRALDTLRRLWPGGDA